MLLTLLFLKYYTSSALLDIILVTLMVTDEVTGQYMENHH